MAITVLLADDHTLFRKGIRLLLEGQEDIRVVGEAGDGRDAVDQVRTLSPDVVIMDISMPNFNGIEATRRIVSAIPSAKVVALSVHSKKQFVEDMLRAGAAGYILKKCVPEDLVNGIRTVNQGQIYLSPKISGIVVSQYKEFLGLSSRTAQVENASTILTTKLHIPPCDSHHIPRLHLFERLDQRRQRVCTIVSAPAGYGKTSLVSSWMEKCAGLSAWVSLDETDNDFRMFLEYFLTAIQTMCPDAVRKTMAMLDSVQLPPLSMVAGSLINELDRIEQPFILSLDDCHLIQNNSVFELLAGLLKNPPQGMHLILISRRDLPLPFHMLRAQSRMTEIRAQDLRFNLEETGALLNKTLGIAVDPATSRAVGDKTEGWVTGLRLAALTLKLKGDIDLRLLEPMVNAQYVMEYLFNEVFSHQPPEFNRYLLGTSILERFCAPLCDAVCLLGEDPSTCEAGGWKFLSWLKQENIFLISIDAENRWFRYHHIFRKFLSNQLERRLKTDEIKAIHAQASEWFIDNNFIEEGIRHSLAAEDISKAVQMVIKHGHDWMNKQNWQQLERWIGKLPRDSVDQSPELLLLEAWLNHARKAGHDLEMMAFYIEKVNLLIERLPEADAASKARLKGHYDALLGFNAVIFGDAEKAKKLMQSACNMIPMDHLRVRVLARAIQAGAYQMTGDLKTGLSLYVDEMHTVMVSSTDYHAMYLVYLCFIYWLEGDLFAMRKNAEQATKIALGTRMPETVAYGLYFSGIASYFQNDLSRAEEQLTELADKYFYINPVMYAHGATVLALVYLARHDVSRGQKLIEQVRQYATATNNKEAYQVLQAFEAEYALRQGRLSEASKWAMQFNPKPFLLPYLYFFPQLTLIKIRMAQDTTESRQEAADLLEQTFNFLESIHNKSSLISVMALQALQLDARGEKSAALEKLAKMLDIAEPGGFIRIFSGLGPKMADLLKQLIKQNIAVEYIRRIQAVMQENEKSISLDTSDHPTANLPFSNTRLLVDPLSDRELGVLNLLTQRLTNKEIATSLFISPGTVKKHLSNIYTKLNVGSRQQAVEKAGFLGIVTPP